MIGAGFTGTMTALHIMRRTGRRVLLCERAPAIARGAAYSAGLPAHLLNVRAANMSAFSDEPNHFAEWLGSRPDYAGEVHETEAGTFVSRDLYGRYLTGLVRDSLASAEGASRLRIVPEEVVDLAAAGDGYVLTLAGGLRHRISAAVIAVGHLLPDATRPDCIVDNPWATPFQEDLVGGKPVAVLGTGLSMVDIAIRLKLSGFRGPVVAISRRGLLPRSHVRTAPWPVPRLAAAEQRSPARLVRRIRREIAIADGQGVAWQSVVDSLRPLTVALWRQLPESGQRTFLRHLRPWWDVHRHRMAPPIGTAIDDLVARGYLIVAAGHVIGIEAGERDATVTYRPRGCREDVSLKVQKVINATGSLSAGGVGDPLLVGLLRQGLARLDRHRLGLDVNDDLEIIDRDGRARPNLWALGPIVRGVFWECTAVPDIRRQAQELSARIAAGLDTAA